MKDGTVELDTLPGVISMPGLLLFTRKYVEIIATTFGINPASDDIDELHEAAVEGFDAVCLLRDCVEEEPPDEPTSYAGWDAFMGAINHVSYVLHNGRTHDGREIRFV